MRHKTVSHAPADSLRIVSGNAQYAALDTAFAHLLVVKVLDAHSSPLHDATQVSFTISPIEGRPSGTAVFVDGHLRATVGILPGDGRASSPAILARRAGPIQVTVEVLNRPLGPKVTFDLDVVGPPHT
jgi:hypothetical protein